MPGIRLSDTCRMRRCPGERRGHLDGVELAGSGWLCADNGDVDKDETEGTEGDNFTGDEQETAGDSIASLISIEFMVIDGSAMKKEQKKKNVVTGSTHYKLQRFQT